MLFRNVFKITNYAIFLTGKNFIFYFFRRWRRKLCMYECGDENWLDMLDNTGGNWYTRNQARNTIFEYVRMYHKQLKKYLVKVCTLYFEKTSNMAKIWLTNPFLYLFTFLITWWNLDFTFLLPPLVLMLWVCVWENFCGFLIFQ